MHASSEETQQAVKKEAIKGDLFIAPFLITSAAECALPYYELSQLRKSLGMGDITLEELLVQVRATDGKINPHSGKILCWETHGNPEIHDTKTFPDLLPLRLVDGKKEGDIIKLIVWGKSIELCCKQQPYRYSNYGLFHEVLKKLQERNEADRLSDGGATNHTATNLFMKYSAV
jgi:hypothetical protein